MLRAADPRRERARQLYTESDIPLREIARRLGLPLGTVTGWVSRYDWPRRSHRLRPSPPGAGEAVTSPDAGAASTGAAAPTKALIHTRPVKRRPRRPTVKRLVDRLYRIITHNLELMETRMSEDDKPAGDNPERDMRAIGNVVRSIEKLKEIEPEQSKRDNAAGPRLLTPDEEDRLRRRIVEHIMRVRERKRRGGGDG